MRSYIINLRGANGSGKTTCVRGYLSKHKISEEDLKLKNGFICKVNVCDNSIVLGEFKGNKIEGIDIYNKKTQIDIVSEAMKKYYPKTLIFESCLLSTSGKTSLDIINKARTMGYEWVSVYLYMRWSERYKRLCGRANREIKTNEVLKILASVERSMETLKKNGVLCKCIDVTETPIEEMYLIVENVINKL